MTNKCPVCNSELFKMKNKFVCESSTCSYQRSVETDVNSVNRWNINICENEALWCKPAFDNYPFIISIEYDRLYNLIKDNQLYGALFQIKDMFEIILKLPVLLNISIYLETIDRTDLQNEIILELLYKPLSLGDWLVIARNIKSNSMEQTTNILKDIIKKFDRNNIVHWRNNTIGHGALGFDDSQEFREDLTNKLKCIKEHFDRCKKDYEELKILTVDKNIRLTGKNLDLADVLSNSNIYFYDNKDNHKYILDKLIKSQNESIYFFDSYFSGKKKAKMLDYMTSSVIEIHMPFFEELFTSLSKFSKAFQTESSEIDDKIYLESEEKLINSLDNTSDIITPEFIKTWLTENIQKDSKGIYLLQMESGMGKTTFSRLLDPHFNGKINIPNTTIRGYYINGSYTCNVEVFENNIIDTLRLFDNENDQIKGAYPKFSDENKQDSLKFAELIEEYRNQYKIKNQKEKLLIIIDGIDEITNTNNSIFNYICSINELHENTYILLTSRTTNENPQYINSKLDEMNFSDKFIIESKNENYQELLKCHIKKIFKVTDDNTIEAIVNFANDKFLYLQPIKYLLKDSSFDLSNVDEQNVFKAFIDLLKNNYGKKHYNTIKNTLVILATSRNGITLNEISYLLGEKKANFKVLAYMTDLKCIIKKERIYNENIFSLSHAKYKEEIFTLYSNDIKDLIRAWLEIFKEFDMQKLLEEEEYLFYNSIFFITEYLNEDIEIYFNIDNLIEIIRQKSNENLINREVFNLINLIDDLISALETDIDSNYNNLLKTYYLRALVYNNLGFGTENRYVEYISKFVNIINEYNIDNFNIISEMLILQCEYYRKNGNIKKQLDLLDYIEDYLKNVGNTDIAAIYDLRITKAYINLSRGTICKNRGDIDKALEYLLLADIQIKDTIKNERNMIMHSNILNAVGLCYNKKKQYNESEAYLLKSIEIFQQYSSDKKEFYIRQANLGQTLKNHNKLDESLELYNKCIRELTMYEESGISIDANCKALLYHGRSNVYFEQLEKELCVSDLKTAVSIIENVELENRNLQFLQLMYGKLLEYYESINGIIEIQLYKNKIQELNRNLYRIQTDDFYIDDNAVDEKVIFINAKNWADKAETENRTNAIELYTRALNNLNNIKNKNDTRYKELVCEINYNLASIKYQIIEEQILEDFNQKMKFGSSNVDFSIYEPLKIIEHYKNSDFEGFIVGEFKTKMYLDISNIYCEVTKDYSEAKIYAINAIESNPYNPHGYTALGNAFAELKEYKKAKRCYEKSLSIDREQETVINCLKYVYNMLGENFKTKIFKF